MRNKVLAVAAAVGLALGSGSASAFYLYPGAGLIPGAQAEDNNIDWFVDNDGDGVISQGDRLVSVLEFTQIVDILPPIDPTSPQDLNTAGDELVAIADVTVKTVGTNTAGAIRVDFEATAGTSAVQVYSLGSTIDLDLGTFANCTDLTSCLAAVSDGTPWAEFSFVDPDDEWFFDSALGGAGLDPSIIAGLPAVTKVGTVNFALSVVPGTNNSGYDFLNVGLPCVPGLLFTCAGDGASSLLGSADILGGSGLPAGLGAFARSDTDVAVNVPEPASLALLGLGLLGMGAVRRRRA